MQQSKGKELDFIVNEMIGAVENSKDEIFNISEEARNEHDQLLSELEDTKEKVIQHIENGDILESSVKSSRKRLSIVSKNFAQYSEDDIREVYERTHDMQTSLAMLRKEEKVLRDRRDDLERRLIKLSQTVERATGLASKASVILNYLYEDFQHVNELIEDAREKQAFSLKIIEAQEEERKKLSREIHDGPAQMFANILLRSELVDRALVDKDTVRAMEELKSVREMIRSSLQEVRRIIYDLRPMALDDLGLVPTLKKYIGTISEHHNIEIEFVFHGEEKRLNQKYEIAFFRLMQESLQNAIKHANATLIKIQLEFGEGYLTMVISDNGKGFDTTVKREDSFGLVGIKERIEMLKGKLILTSSEGNGTRIFINVPYHSDS